MNKIPIVFVMNTLKTGGAEKQSIDIINGLNKLQYTIRLICFDENRSLVNYITELDKVEIIHLKKTLKIDFGIAANLCRYLRKIKPEYVVTVNQYPLIYVAPIVKLAGINAKIVQINHTTVFPSRYLQSIVRYIVAPLMKNVDTNIFVCNSQKTYWTNKYHIRNENVTVIHNGVDVNKFSDNYSHAEKLSLRKEIGVNPEDILIVLCANMRPEKRHTDLVTALRNLRQKGHRAKLLFIGDGQQRAHIEQYIQCESMDEHVVMVGHISDVRPYLAVSDIFVIASDAVETFSIAVLEAMSMGKAIVASDIGGIREQVKNGYNGYIFPPRDINCLNSYLEQIIMSGEYLKMGENSRKMVEENYSISKMNEKYASIFV